MNTINRFQEFSERTGFMQNKEKGRVGPRILTDKAAMEEFGSIPDIARIFDKASDFIFVVDQDYRIIEINRSFLEILGKNYDQVKGKRCCEIVHGTAEPPGACPLAQASAGGGSVVQQVFGSRQGIHVLLSVMPIFTESNRLLATVHVGRVIYNLQREQLKDGDSKLDSDPGTLLLTPRQRAVLELLTEGRSSKEIAYRLKVSPRTVEFHKRQLMAKLKIKNLAGLIKFAFIEDLVR